MSFRTPLTAIYFFITNLLEGVAGNLTSGQREHLEFSLENVKQLKDMVSDLLDVSRVESLQTRGNSSAYACARASGRGPQGMSRECGVKEYQPAFKHRAGSPSCLGADRARVRQILTNLIDNGIKFTPNNGTVTVRVRVLRWRTRIFSAYPW